MSEEASIQVNFTTPKPLFPLDAAVLLPQQILPLHVFEERYTQMVSEALDSAGQFAMAVFQGNRWKQEYHGCPPIRPVVCVAQIIQHEQLEDGRFNIVLRGVERVRILEPEASELAEGKLYRLRPIETAREHPPEPSEATSALLRAVRSGWNELLRKSGRSEPESQRMPEDASFEELMNHVATFMDIPPHAKQELLDEDDLIVRAAHLEGHLDEQLKFWRTLSRFRKFSPDDPSVN